MTTKILNALSIIAGLGMTVFGLNKFINFMPMPEMPAASMEAFGHLMGLKWVLPLAGFVEVLGGILLLMPKTRALGAIVLLPIIVGIIAHNATFDPASLPVGLVFGGIIGWLIYSYSDRYMAMIK